MCEMGKNNGQQGHFFYTHCPQIVKYNVKNSTFSVKWIQVNDISFLDLFKSAQIKQTISCKLLLPLRSK